MATGKGEGTSVILELRTLRIVIFGKLGWNLEALVDASTGRLSRGPLSSAATNISETSAQFLGQSDINSVSFPSIMGAVGVAW